MQVVVRFQRSYKAVTMGMKRARCVIVRSDAIAYADKSHHGGLRWSLSVPGCPFPVGHSMIWWLVTLGTAPGGVERFALLGLHCTPRGPVNWRRRLVAVHARSVWDRYAARSLHDLLAGWRPRRRSPAAGRQATVTAALAELHPKQRTLKHHRPRLIEIRRRVA